MIIYIGISLALTGQQGGGNFTPPSPKLLLWGAGNTLQWGGTDLAWGIG